jgi:Transposase DDE domain group 1
MTGTEFIIFAICSPYVYNADNDHNHLFSRGGRIPPAAAILPMYIQKNFAKNLVNLFRLQLPQPWRSAQIETLRARLFKLGARVRQTARCIRFHLATGWPFQNLFHDVALAVNSS